MFLWKTRNLSALFSDLPFAESPPDSAERSKGAIAEESTLFFVCRNNNAIDN